MSLRLSLLFLKSPRNSFCYLLARNPQMRGPTCTPHPSTLRVCRLSTHNPCCWGTYTGSTWRCGSLHQSCSTVRHNLDYCICTRKRVKVDMLSLSTASIQSKIVFLNCTETVLFTIALALLDIIHIWMSIHIQTFKKPEHHIKSCTLNCTEVV